MKRFLLFFSLAVCAAAVLFTSCKAKTETNYVDLVKGRWHVDSVFPELPEGKYFVDGDEFLLNSDMTLVMENEWRGYFTEAYWTVALELEDHEYYISMKGVRDEKDYLILFARISGVTENQMALEVIDEVTSTTYRIRLSRVTQ